MTNSDTSSTPYWEWLSILSLDAPLVALGWQASLSWVVDAGLGWPHYALLAAATWLTYATDRWIEGWVVPEPKLGTARHRFYLDNRWRVLGIWITVASAAIVCALAWMSAREWSWGLLQLALVGTYELSHQWIHRKARFRVPKELVISILFTAGVGFFPVFHARASLALLLLPGIAVFLSCLSNCTLIGAWEREVDISHGRKSLALRFSWAERGAGLLAWTASLCSLGCLPLLSSGLPRLGMTAVGIGAAFLGWLSIGASRMSPRKARVLADLALMPPVLVLVIAALR